MEEKLCFRRNFLHFFFLWEETYHAYHSGHRQENLTVPQNYQQKLNDMNKLIAEYSDGKKEPETFTGYIDKIRNYCIEHSNQCVVTGKKPASKK